MKKLTVPMSPAERRKLTKFAKANRTSKSGVARDATRAFLAGKLSTKPQ